MTIAADLSKEEAPAQIVKEAVDKLGGDLLASRTWTLGPQLSNFGNSLVLSFRTGFFKEQTNCEQISNFGDKTISHFRARCFHQQIPQMRTGYNY